MKPRYTPTGKKLPPFSWPTLRHPIHWLCGLISAGCLVYPNEVIGITAAVMTAGAFYIYEKWEDDYLKDESWKDWWEWATAFIFGVVLVLIFLTIFL